MDGTVIVGLAIAISAPLTAAIVRLRNGKHVTTREFDSFKISIGDSLVEIKAGVRELRQYVESQM